MAGLQSGGPVGVVGFQRPHPLGYRRLDPLAEAPLLLVEFLLTLVKGSGGPLHHLLHLGELLAALLVLLGQALP